MNGCSSLCGRLARIGRSLATILTMTVSAALAAEPAAPREGEPPFLGAEFHVVLAPAELKALALPASQGNVIWGLYPGSHLAATHVGLGDALVAVDGQPTPTAAEVDKILEQHRAGDLLTLEFLHGATKRNIKVQLDARPADLNKITYRLATQGASWAQWRIGLDYYHGQGTKRDLPKARYWIEKAADSGLAHPEWFLGQMYEKGEGGRADLQRAYALYEKSADVGYAPAQCQLGLLYRDGRGAPRSDEMAVRWLIKAAGQRSADAQYQLAFLILAGTGIPKDEHAAFFLFRRAAVAGHLEAQSQLAYMYYHGLGTAQDYAAASRWAEKPAKAGNVIAQTTLGNMYHFGHGVVRDDAAAARWYFAAAAKGYVGAQLALGMMYTQAAPPDFAQALKWLQKAAEQDDADAEYHLGLMYQFGSGVAKDDQEAFRLYHRAAEKGNVAAETAVGTYCLSGGPVAKHEPIAFQWFHKAADRGYAEAQFKLGVMFAAGLSVPKDEQEARTWYEKAAQQGHLEAQYNLGQQALEQQDYATAARWLRPAAEQGFAEAQTSLGALYENGWGVAQSRADAIAWYRRAAQHGDSTAQQKLQSLGVDSAASLVSAEAKRTTTEAKLPLQRPNGRLMFEDHFDTPRPLAEPLFGRDVMSFEHVDGRGRLRGTSTGVLGVVYGPRQAKDFAVEYAFQVARPKPNCSFGFLFRSERDAQGLPSYYLLLVDPTRQKISFNCWQRDWTAARQIPLEPGQIAAAEPNKVRLEAVGHEFRIFLNGVLVGQLIDEKIDRPGIFGLFLSATSADENTVDFSDLRVYELPPADPAVSQN